MAPRRSRATKRAVDDDLARLGLQRLHPPVCSGNRKLLYKCNRCSTSFDRLQTAQNHSRVCPVGEVAGRLQSDDEGTRGGGDDTGSQPLAGPQPHRLLDLGRVAEVLIEVRCLAILTRRISECRHSGDRDWCPVARSLRALTYPMKTTATKMWTAYTTTPAVSSPACQEMSGTHSQPMCVHWVLRY